MNSGEIWSASGTMQAPGYGVTHGARVAVEVDGIDDVNVAEEAEELGEL